MKGIGIETGTGTPDGTEGLKEGATMNGTEETKDEVEAMKKGAGDMKNMAAIENLCEKLRMDHSRSTLSLSNSPSRRFT